MKQFWACQPRAAKSASASLTPAWIFSAVMPGGSAGSEKSTVAGSRPINTTRFIDPPLHPQTQWLLGAGSAIEVATNGLLANHEHINHEASKRSRLAARVPSF